MNTALKHSKKICCLLVLPILLAGCMTTPKEQATGMYLRSEFTWWEARPNFEFIKLENGRVMMDANIVPDGKPYHLKIADKSWSADKNCGPGKHTNITVELGVWLDLNCHYDAKNDQVTPLKGAFIFKPPQPANYQFEIKQTNGLPSQLKVTLVSDN